jgi:hypothetical protein
VSRSVPPTAPHQSPSAPRVARVRQRARVSDSDLAGVRGQDAQLAEMPPRERAAELARRAAFREAHRFSGDPAKAPEKVWALLHESYPTPIAARDAISATGMPELWLHELMSGWAAWGRIEHVSYGTYRIRDEAIVAA